MAFETYAKSFALGTSSAELSLGLGANEALQVTSAVAVNTSGAARSLYLNLASDGGAAAAGNAVESAKAIAANSSTGTALTGMNIIPGSKVYGYADVSGVTLQLSGLVVAQTERTW